MTIRTDVTVDFSQSPRIITVAAPSVEITIQDLHDTCRDIEAKSYAMDEPKLIDSAGKENLGGGTSVGLTSTLQNALIAFEARPGPTYVQCRVNGGNVVAIDDVGADLPTPIFPTAFTQVVTTASSSATTQSQAQLEHSTFNQAVWVDTVNGASGTDFPFGTPSDPVNNFVDAKVIADARGFSTMRVVTDATLDTGDDVSNFRLIGENAARTALTINPASDTLGLEIRDAFVTGTLDGITIIRECSIDNLAYFNGFLFLCQIAGKITLGSGAQANILNCFSGIPGSGTPEIDFGGSGQSLALRGYSGGILLTNKTGPEPTSIDLLAGQVRIDLTTVTNGQIVVRGNGKVVDASNDDWLPSGTYGGLELINETDFGLMTQEIWTRLALDPDVPVTNKDDGSYTAGGIDVAATPSGTDIIQTRQ